MRSLNISLSIIIILISFTCLGQEIYDHLRVIQVRVRFSTEYFAQHRLLFIEETTHSTLVFVY